MPVTDADRKLVALVVAEVLRRQPLDTSTEALVRVAVQSDEKATTALRLLRDEAA